MDEITTVESAIELITPDTAKTMLERVFSAAKVDTPSRQAFARDMTAHQWVLNGAPIVFSAHGACWTGALGCMPVSTAEKLSERW